MRCTVLGVVAGARATDLLSLSFAVPLTFLALLVPAVTGRASGTAAVVAWRTESVLAAIAVGMATLVGLGFVLCRNHVRLHFDEQ